jgi:hypothetical protein
MEHRSMKKSKWSKREHSGQMTLDTYRPGDRVVLLADLNGIPAGTEGRVTQGNTSEYYPVLWDGTACPRGMFEDEIGPVAGEMHE